MMNIKMLAMAASALGALALIDAEKLDFEKDAVGKAPAGFTSYATADGPAGIWIVRDE